MSHKQPCKPQQSAWERIFEASMWNSRFMVLIAVVASLIMAVAVFYMTAVDVFYTLEHLTHYAALGEEARATMKAKTVAHVVGAVDGFLLGTIMLIFSLGIYELFISKIDAAENSEGASKILMIDSLDDLKDRLAKVIVMILIVMFFEQAIYLKPTAPLELLYYSLAITLVALALYFSHKAYEEH